MEIRDARTISADELQEKRRMAIDLYKKGMNFKDIAPIIGVHRNTIGKWVKMYQEDGSKGLKVGTRGKPKGSGRLLNEFQEKTIQKMIVDNSPEQLKLDFYLWTSQAVRDLIYDMYSIVVAMRTVRKYLHEWGFTPQKPTQRAYQRNDAAVIKWKEETYPAIKAQAEAEGGEIFWGDQTGIKSNPSAPHGYAPKGKTPIAKFNGVKEKINMMSCISNRGKVYFKFYEDNFNAASLIEFLSRVIKTVHHKVFMILDNLPSHHNKTVKEWVSDNKSRIELFFLPSYSPDLNPDEYLNSDLKRTLRSKPREKKKGMMKKKVLSIMKSIQKRPDRVKTYFRAKSVRYAL